MTELETELEPEDHIYVEVSPEELSNHLNFDESIYGSVRNVQHAASKALMLSPEQQQAATRDQLVMSYMRLVGTITRPWRNDHFYHDLYQDGLTELVVSAEKYDPNLHTCTFGTFVITRVRSIVLQKLIIYKYPLRIVTTKSLRLVYNNISKYRTDDQPLSYLQKQQMSQDLKVAMHTIDEMLDRMSNASVPIIIAPMPSSEDDQRTAEGNIQGQSIELSDTTYSPDVILDELESKFNQSNMLNEALSTILLDRERSIINSRFLSETPATLAELGRQHGCSAERIRQIEARAINKMKQFCISRNV